MPDGLHPPNYPPPPYVKPKPSPQKDVDVATELQARIVSASKILAQVMTDAERAGLIVMWDPIVRYEDQGGVRYAHGAVRVMKLLLGPPSAPGAHSHE
jgi:hypothetical protein